MLSCSSPQEAASEMKTNVFLKCFWRGRQGEEAGQADGAPSFRPKAASDNPWEFERQKVG